MRATCEPEEAEEDVRLLAGAGVTDKCKQPRGCREPRPGPLREQPVLLTPEPSLQSRMIV